MRHAASLCLVAALLTPAAAQQNPNGQLDVTAFPQPYLLLIRDPHVHAALDLTAEQRRRLRAACDRQDVQFWKLRGMSAEQAAQGLRTMTESMQKVAAEELELSQRQRLAQIEMQLGGMKVFQDKRVVDTLRLTENQQKSIDFALTTFQTGYKALLKRAQSGEEDPQRLDAEATELRSQLRTAVSETLTDPQKRAWQLLVGERIDASKLGRVKFKAPPLDGQEPWLNTRPMDAEDLRGNVVAMHFWAFRCINCQRNLPWYKQWHDEFGQQGLVTVGIHTPELDSERDVAAVRDNARQQGLQYPILIDNDKRLWGLWGNTMWPTTYLIDKQGYVRYWWYGELNWKDAGAQDVFKTRIAELLQETAP